MHIKKIIYHKEVKQMSYDFYSSELSKAKDSALHGYDLSSDQYYTVLKTCRETSAWDEKGKLARGILYHLKRNGWRQLRYVSNRNTSDEEYYANQGYTLY